jgi:hypothetical protein
MAAATLIPTKLKKSQVLTAGPQLKLDDLTLVALIVVAGSGIPDTSKTGIQFIGDVTATNAELSYSGYARQSLTGNTVAFDGSLTTTVDFSFSPITFPHNTNDPGTGRYLIIADTGVGASDATHPVLAVCDPNQFISSAAGDLVLQSPTGGLIQFQ